MQSTEQRLLYARRQKRPGPLAVALTEHADQLSRQGQLSEARTLLDEAAALHRQLRHAYDEVRCLHLAATLSRFVGDLDGSRERATRALQQAQAHTPEAASSAAELAESWNTCGDAEQSARYWLIAIEHAEAAGALPGPLAGMYRRCAMSLAGSAQWHAAMDALAKARALYLGQDDKANALRTLIETTTAWVAQDKLGDAYHHWDQSWSEAQAISDLPAQADLLLIQASLHLKSGEHEAARKTTAKARQAALDANMPVNYVTTSLMLAELAEHAQDLEASYAALATGWATLGNLLGREVAAESFRPHLQALRERLGEARFAEVKHRYEAKRREQRAAASPSSATD
ncbi:tetratricopeptide repeat protein [Dyella flagellata]|uniref:MalT-like TPR region domain-containing protein n=1 Tax=Dyella flagellata TaxID=1867833 RepID=A0ABQ5XE50_9GAMM|nr:hypothetical protein [Dyella flagellata]GLQ89928.1 hypothetical protein GCM10007898_35030 [Dyella flagellata]